MALQIAVALRQLVHHQSLPIQAVIARQKLIKMWVASCSAFLQRAKAYVLCAECPLEPRDRHNICWQLYLHLLVHF